MRGFKFLAPFSPASRHTKPNLRPDSVLFRFELDSSSVESCCSAFFLFFGAIFVLYLPIFVLLENLVNFYARNKMPGIELFNRRWNIGKLNFLIKKIFKQEMRKKNSFFNI
ncbi:hypothetical protein BpHYR1_005166 [Brachionus plicatilis]|uniref:Uncharacterized protein n=1 Tax=Brachionus plicatilis TaxID=10195 RepID=A0A3M7RJQ3_BRAPC|nr:hypothetical protein BpHYR1_005166 [Brachionus plicatilis]